MIKGTKIDLIPATLDDRRKVYEWCFQSETTKSHAGPPDYPGISIPTYEEFCATDDGGYEAYYFTGERPEDGRGFLIVSAGEPVGFISYCSFHLKPSLAELDLWMGSEQSCGKGFGTDALVSLGDFLNRTMGISELIIAPSRKNLRAIRSYEKAGFKKSEKAMSEFLREEYVPLFGSGDYGTEETFIMSKRFDA